jgi:Fur family transcriptional regulator, ferric uptake regulator
MVNREDAFKKYLRSKGLKFTPERRLILSTILSFTGHFDIEKLHNKLRKRNKEISIATIYRSLPHFINSGLIREVMCCKNRPQYELDMGASHHDHIVCMKCGKIIEFRDDKIEKLLNKVCERFHFKPVEHRLGIRGYCEECQKKMKRDNS